MFLVRLPRQGRRRQGLQGPRAAELQEQRGLQGGPQGPQQPHPARHGQGQPLRPRRGGGRLEVVRGQHAPAPPRGTACACPPRCSSSTACCSWSSCIDAEATTRRASSTRPSPPSTPARCTATCAARSSGCSAAISSTATSRRTTSSWRRRGRRIIDFPQIISAAHNTQSERFFLRDVDNILRFFAGLDRRLHAHGGDAREIWRAYARRELTPDFVPSRDGPQAAPNPGLLRIPAGRTPGPAAGSPSPCI